VAWEREVEEGMQWAHESFHVNCQVTVMRGSNERETETPTRRSSGRCQQVIRGKGNGADGGCAYLSGTS
jgi:hypothetical protein